MFFRPLIAIFEINLEDTFTHCENFQASLMFFRSFIRIFEVNSKIHSLAVKNIQVNLIFLARLFVSLSSENGFYEEDITFCKHYMCVGTLCDGLGTACIPHGV